MKRASLSEDVGCEKSHLIFFLDIMGNILVNFPPWGQGNKCKSVMENKP